MTIETFEHPFVTCEISANEDRTKLIGKLTYRGFENGILTGDSVESVRNQWQNICSLVDNDGAMLRRGTIMMGYHNDDLKGPVLLPDGEVIGHWHMEEDDDWSHFVAEGLSEAELTAPSAWMLQDSIAEWLERKK